MRTFAVFLIAILFSFSARADVVDLSSRGETVRLLVEKEGEPWVTVVLFAGGKGVLDIGDGGDFGWGGSNFVVRTRETFQELGAVTAVIDAPSDKPLKLGKFRGTEEHAGDVAAVIRHLREKFKLPVWLIGTSRGTESIANAATRLEGADRPDGIVLTSSMLKKNKIGYQVLDFDLAKVKGPVLVSHHKKDACAVTPPGGVAKLKDALINAGPVKVMWYEDGFGMHGNPCHANHYHGFKGIEEKVVRDIMAWVKSPAP